MDATRSSLLIRRSRRSRLIATPRERIERTAYELFSRHGVRAVGVDTLSARAGVAKMTLYKHYPCKDELALAFLRRREELWTRAWLQGEVERSNGTAGAKLLAIFEVFDTWFRRPDFEACAFVRVLLEHHAPGHPLRRAAVRHLGNIRTSAVADPDDRVDRRRIRRRPTRRAPRQSGWLAVHRCRDCRQALIEPADRLSLNRRK